MVTKIEKKEDLAAAFQAGKLVVVDFYADWCGPCREIAPKIEEMTKRHTNVVFLKVDVDNADTKSLVSDYSVKCMPTFVLIKDGKVLDRMEGAQEKELEELITANE